MRVEWSKGWGYTDSGPWTNADVIGTKVPDSLRNGRPSDAAWDQAVQQLARFDSHAVFMNPFLEHVMPAQPPTDCPGDLNGDGQVGGGDLTVLLSAWGPGRSPADLDGDGERPGPHALSRTVLSLIHI